MNDPDTVLFETESAMEKALEYLKHELRGIRTGRATTALVDFLKVDYYGAQTDLKSLGAISVPEPTQLLIKPFDPGSGGYIKKAIEASGLGLNPIVEAKQIRLNVPPLSGERRQQLVGKVREVRRGHDGLHAGQRLGLLRIDRDDAGVGVGAAQDLAGELAGHDEVRAVGGASGSPVDKRFHGATLYSVERAVQCQEMQERIALRTHVYTQRHIEAPRGP